MSVLWFTVGAVSLVPLLIIQQHRITALRRTRQASPDGEDCRLLARKLIEAMPVPVFYRTPDGRFAGCNGAFAEFIGRRRDEIIGRTVHEVAPQELADRHAAADAALLARPGSRAYETHVQSADGTLRDVVLHKATFERADGSVGGIIGVIMDVTERRHADRVLQQSERKFRALAENMPANLIRYDRHARVEFMNPALVADVSPDVLPKAGKSPGESYPGNEAAARHQRIIESVIATGTPEELECQLPNPRGEVRIHHIRYVAERDGDGEIVGALGIGRDITERKRTEAYEQFRARTLELLSGEDKLQEVLEGIERGVERFNTELICSIQLRDGGEGPPGPADAPGGAGRRDGPAIPGAEDGHGAGRRTPAGGLEGVVVAGEGDRHSEWVPFEEPDSGSGFPAWGSEPIRSSSGQLLGLLVVHHRDAYALTDLDASIIGMSAHLASIAIERRRAEEALRASERDFRTLADNLPDHIARYDRNGRWVYLNRRLAEYLGVEVRDVLGKSVRLDCVPGLEYPKYLDCLDKVLATGQPAEVDVAWAADGKELRHHNVRFVVEHGPDGEIGGALAIGRDVTERHRIQRQLEIQTAALNHSHDAVFLMDETLRFVFVNETACRSLGYSREELLRMGPLDIDPDIAPETALAIRATMMAGVAPPVEFETRHRAKNGRTHPVAVCASLFQHEGKSFALSVVRDTTDRNRLENALRFVAQRGWQEGGENLFDALVRYLGETLDVDYAMVAKLGRSGSSVTTVALYAEGTVAPNVRYDLSGTPYDHVMDQACCCFPSGVRDLFPEDRLLAEMGAESYAGIALWDSRGQPLGLIAVAGRGPLQDEVWAAQLLQVVAPQAAAELERARSDAALRAREHEFRSLAASSPDSVIRYDCSGRIVYLNLQMARDLGVSAPEAIGRPLCAIWPDGRFAGIQRAVGQAMEMATDVTIEIDLPRPSGESGVSQIRIVPEWDGAGEVIGAIAFGRDITELKRYQETLAARELEFRSLAENAPDNIVRFDQEGRLLYLNRKLARTLGVDARDAVGRMPREVLPSWDMAPIDKVLTTGEPVEIEFAAPDAEAMMRQYQIRFVAERGPQGAIAGVLGIGRDVTRRKRAERDLLMLSSAIDKASDGIFLIDDQLRFTYVNDRACRALGYSRQELLSMGPGDLDTDIPRDELACIQALLRAHGPVVRFETGARATDGRAIFLEVSVSLVEHEEEQMALLVARDITKRKSMEETLLRREEEFRSLAENLPDVVMRYDLECRHIYANPAYMREVEAPEEEVLMAEPDVRHWRSSSMSLADYKTRLLRVMRTGEPAELMLDWARRSDGAAARFAMRMVAERDADGRVIGALCIGRNVIKLVESERRLEASRRQLRDLAARREDAREEERRHIARELHDELGQQLSALRFKLGLLAYDFGGSQPEIRPAVDNLMGLVSKTIQTTRQVSSALRPAVLDMGIVPALEWLVAEYAQHGAVSFQLAAGQEEMRMNDACRVALFRVVQESLTNAMRHSKADRIEVVLGRDADAYVVEVRDDGIGFDPEAPRDRRSVGLVGMHERALAVGGELTVFSSAGRGTTLRVRIPVEVDQKEAS